MPIPFSDLSESSNLGLAAFLRFQDEPGGKGLRAALFLITDRGEPIEFSFTRIDIGASFLWREGDAKRHAVANLSKKLFEATSGLPCLILALEDEVAPQVFAEDLSVNIPICRVSSKTDTIQDPSESAESLGDTLSLFWAGGQPESDDPARSLLEALRVRQLLTEPFDRAEIGLNEAFKIS